MTTTDARLAQAIKDLDWCLTIPHTLDRIIGLWAEHQDRNGRPLSTRRLSNDELVERTRKMQNGNGGKGQHSDPTGEAAVYGAPDLGDDADETISRLTVATITVWDATCDLTTTLGHPVTLAPTNRHQRIQATTAQLHRLTITDADLAALPRDEHAHAAWLIADPIAGTASWLRTKAEGMWADTKGERQPVAQQRAIVACRIHAQWVNDPPASITDDGLCDRCKNFRSNHGCEPTEQVVKWWDTGYSYTPSRFVIEAKAGGRKGA